MSQPFCMYCILREFSTLYLNSTPRARLFKSDVYSSNYDDSIVEFIHLLNYNIVIPLDCMLPADLAIYLANPLIGLSAH